MKVQWKKGLSFVGALVASTIIVISTAMIAIPAVSQIAGLAVAQSSTNWNSVIDASRGDSQTQGILGMSSYLYNGLTFDRARGDITNGQDVDVTRISGSITPADAYANPTTANQMWSLCGLFNGTTWDRCRGSITNGMLTEKKTVGTAFYAIKRDNITTASVNLAYGFTSRKISIEVPMTNTDEVCVDWLGGTAVCPAANTAGDSRLLPGSAMLIDDYAGTSISVIAASGTQVVYVRAWQ